MPYAIGMFPRWEMCFVFPISNLSSLISNLSSDICHLYIFAYLYKYFESIFGHIAALYLLATVCGQVYQY